jgi:hypothetical protein
MHAAYLTFLCLPIFLDFDTLERRRNPVRYSINERTDDRFSNFMTLWSFVFAIRILGISIVVMMLLTFVSSIRSKYWISGISAGVVVITGRIVLGTCMQVGGCERR